MTQLPIPDAAQRDPRAIEMLRVWAALGGQHVSIKTGLWEDPAIWGLMLVDLARHVARAHEQLGQMSSVDFLDRLKLGFDTEWNSPTDAGRGQLVR